MDEKTFKEKRKRYANEIKRFAAIFDLLSDHVIITDENAAILYANPAVQEHTGFMQQNIIGKNPGDLWGGQMDKEFYENMWRIIKVEKKSFVGEVQNRRRDGTQYWQEIRITPVLDRKKAIKFFIAIEPNITVRKEREIFKEEFISIIGHQLKNALVGISWTLELFLRKNPSLSTKQKQAIQGIFEENGKLGALVRDLLVLARFQSNHLVKKEPLYLQAELRSMLTAIHKKYPNVQYIIKGKENFKIQTFRALALQVFLNIVMNAFEYSNYSQNGKVLISLKKK